MPFYRKRPVLIEAVRWTNEGDSLEQVLALAEKSERRIILRDDGTADLVIPTLEGELRARVGDYIILGVAHELYPCKARIFEATYDQEGAEPVKNKSRLCSTGHDTGAQHRRGLHAILEDERRRKSLKRMSRRGRRRARGLA